ncbi:MAG: hypothetical protein L0Z62_41145, partial [Gemmataceae bacterium]|nr:hypothetical protein [Gemmataceae bacterium]
MNQLIHIVLCIDTAPLTPEDQTLVRLLLEALTGLPADQLLRYFRVLHLWDRAPASRKALALKLLDARLPSNQVAPLC